jgi:hypothetical protein
MTALDPTRLHPRQLADMLRNWADGIYADEAAIGLLASHGTWLCRRDFLATCVDAIDDGWTRQGSAAMASIDWPRAAALADRAPCSTSEAAILRISCSLVGLPTGDLAGLTRGLDPHNLAHVLDAIAHRAGWHEKNHRHTVTGRQHSTTHPGNDEQSRTTSQNEQSERDPEPIWRSKNRKTKTKSQASTPMQFD